MKLDEQESELEDNAPFAAFPKLFERIHSESSVSVGGLWGASQALVLAELARRAQGPWLAIASTDQEAESFALDLNQFDVVAEYLPSRAGGRGGADVEAVRERLRLARALQGTPDQRPRLVVASVLALLQPMPTATDLEQDLITLSTGEVLVLKGLVARLVKAGFTREPLVERPGELSLRGDILDVWPFAAERPLRIELFDDEIESLRTFDPEEQRSVETLEKAALCLATDAGGVEDGDGVMPFSVVAPTTVFVEVEPLRIEDKAEGLRIQSASHGRALLQLREAQANHRRLQLQSLPAKTLNLDVRSTELLAGDVALLGERLTTFAAEERVRVYCRTESEMDRFGGLAGKALETGAIDVRSGMLSKGFRFPAMGVAYVNYRELVGVASAERVSSKRKSHKSRALQSFFELRPGDYVVHAVHGLARFIGLERMARGGGEEEHLHLIFADEVSLFVPAARIDLVQRYIGSGSASIAGPKLDKIGGGAFRKRREKVERALFDLASQLLDVQAQRELQQREPWPVDDELVRSMVAAFQHEATADQVTIDEEIAEDLTSKRPMDRLLCGDVGFGKTEIAIRAAYRIVSAGAQVAVLVPTTVLAEQHEKTFRERLAGFPVTVAGISRYATGKKAKEILAGCANGSVDILIGTHRLLSKDVTFQRLGLVITDEEQRFGVQHKEHFKNYRAHIDVLALSATPIPRTLHMSLAGLRDISALSEPPPGRQEIETKVIYDADADVIRDALLREKNRGGQVFFLHNRVQSIAARARALADLVPECTYGVGHGQMTARELKAVMDGFTRGAFDVLVATTIVENGLDIPAAGTIFIDDADRFGLSEMHQLRGRVGRGSQRAWCYLILDKTKPIRPVARERIKALEELTHLGAGFAISMKDLEIRGAGNLLGPEQSGHIGAVGYDMYCRLLKSTVERVQTGGTREETLTIEKIVPGVELELGRHAFLPDHWIPSQESRIEILRQLDAIETDADAKEALASLRDRFGRVPAEAEELVRHFRLRARLAPIGIRRLAWRGDSYLIEYADRVALEGLIGKRRIELRPLKHGLALLMTPPDKKDPALALAWLESWVGR